MSHNPYWNTYRGLKPWTSQDDQRVLEMVRNRTRYHVIAKALGRTETAIRMRLIVIDPKRAVRRALTLWSTEKLDLAKKLIEEKADKAVFERLVGLSMAQAKNKLIQVRYRERMDSDEPPPRPAVIVPAEVIEDRNRRLMAERDLTATIMGDPPRGYSALERRQ